VSRARGEDSPNRSTRRRDAGATPMNVRFPPVLVVDDEKNMRASLKTVLSDEGYAARAVESAEEALSLLGREEFFMVITDARLGGMSGYEFLAKVRSQWPDLPVLMITAYATPKLAVEAIKSGAIDYLAKPFAPEELLHAVASCVERYRLLQENARLRARATETFQLEQIVGECPKIRELRHFIQTVAPTDARVLVLGESGTGKELVAAIRRTLTRSSCVPPTRVKVPSSRNRSNLAWSGRLISAISSRKMVPPSASSTRPGFCFRAPVNAPFSWPNNSLSSRVSGMAAQLMRT